MAETLYENYDDYQATISYRTTHWGAQTFTPSEDHNITKVRLRALRSDADLGTCIISIQGVDGEGHPDGDELVSLEFGGTDLPTSGTEWYTFTFATNPLLSASTPYAIVIRAPSAPADKTIFVGRRFTDPAYLNGNMEDSTNGGSSWSTLTQDWCFEEWGVIVEEAPTVTTQAADNAGFNAVKGHGTIASKGGLTVTKRGFCYNLTGNPDVNDNVKEETGDFETGAFSLLVDGLLPSTKYYVRAYAYNSEGYGYGDTVEITTSASRQVIATLSSRFAGKAANITYALMYGGGGDVQIHPPEYTTPDNLCGVDDHYTASPWLFRTFLFFNLEALEGIVFSKVTLLLWCYSSSPEPINPFCITEGLQDDPVVLANWVPQNAVTTILGQKNQEDFGTGQYNEIVFNSDGLALVNSKRGSTLKLCLRTKRDIDNDFWASLHDSTVYVYLPHESGKEPLLDFAMGRSQAHVL